MSILARYISREFGKLFGLCISTFIFIYLLVDFIERSNSFFKYRASAVDVLSYFVYKIPLIVFQTIPAAVLLATMLSLCIMARHSEIVAMKASGISILRIATPLIALAAMISAAAFIINEYVVPFTNAKADYVERVNIKGKEPRYKHKRKRVWYKAPGGIYNISIYLPKDRLMKGVTMYFFDSGFQLTKRIQAERAEWRDGRWIFTKGSVRIFENGVPVSSEEFEEGTFPIPEVPEDFAVIEKPTDEMSFRELSRFVKKVEYEGVDTTKYRVDLHGKVAFSLVSVIMCLLAIPFALRTGRQGGIAAGVGLAIVISIVYWIFLSMFLSLGHSGRLPEVISAWGSHIVFGVVGIVLMVKVAR